MRHAESTDWGAHPVGDMYDSDPNQRWFGEFAAGARAAVQSAGKWLYGPLLGGLFLEVYDAATKSVVVIVNPPYDVA